MNSHLSEFSETDLGRALATTLFAFALLLGTMHLLNWLDWLPTARSIQTTDELVFEHRREVSTTSTADVIIIGDSSSAIDIEAPLLQSLLPGNPEVANQGLLMGLPLPLYAEPAEAIISNREGKPTIVVQLFTPTFLVRDISSPYHVSLWRRLEDHRNPKGEFSYPAWTAIDIGRERIAAPWYPWTLNGRATVYLPHILHADKHLRKHQGSRYDIGMYNPPTSNTRTPDWTVRSNYLQEATEVRERLGDDTVLVLGLAPLPESMVSKNFKQTRDQMLLQLNRTLRADVLLTNLPATFPNGYCASEVHLNQRGADRFTRLLAAELTKLPPLPNENNP